MVNHQRKYRNFLERNIIYEQIVDNLSIAGLTINNYPDIKEFFDIIEEFLKDETGKTFQGVFVLKKCIPKPIEIEYFLPGRRILQQYSRVKEHTIT